MLHLNQHAQVINKKVIVLGQDIHNSTYWKWLQILFSIHIIALSTLLIQKQLRLQLRLQLEGCLDLSVFSKSVLMIIIVLLISNDPTYELKFSV